MTKSSSPPGRATRENSGLIDLDALMREADSQRDVAHAATTPAVPAPPSSAAPVVAPPTRMPRPDTRAEMPTIRPPAAEAKAKAEAEANAIVIPSAPRPASIAAADDSLQAMIGAPAKPTRKRLLLAATAVLLLGGGVAGVTALRSSAPHALASVTASTSLRNAAAPPSERAAAAPATGATAQEPSVDPNALPAVAEPAPTAAPAHSRSGMAAAASAATPPTTAPATTARAQVSALDLPPSAGSEPGDLAGAMRSAVGPEATKNPAAEGEAKNAGARQIRPPPGQVVGAINSVLPSARACLGPDDPVRTGSIVFASDGSVAHVTLQGQKPSDTCVRTALSKARVQAFADDNFTTRITVRP